MNPNQPPPPLTAELITQILGKLRQQESRIEGEISTMRNDTNTATFNSIANMFNQLQSDKDSLEQALGIAQATLEDIYKGHPDIKISMDAKAKEKAEAQAKKVKINPPPKK